MPTIARHFPVLDMALGRRRQRGGDARRDRCRRCHRTPLIGEQVHFYEGPAGTRLVCDLCRPVESAAPARSQLMHAPEAEGSVSVRRHAR